MTTVQSTDGDESVLSGPFILYQNVYFPPSPLSHVHWIYSVAGKENLLASFYKVSARGTRWQKIYRWKESLPRCFQLQMKLYEENKVILFFLEDRSLAVH